MGEVDQTLEQVAQRGSEVSILETSWLDAALSRSSVLLAPAFTTELEYIISSCPFQPQLCCVSGSVWRTFLSISCLPSLEYRQRYSNFYFLSFAEPAGFLSVVILKAWMFALLPDWSASKGCRQDGQERLVEVFIRISLQCKETAKKMQQCFPHLSRIRRKSLFLWLYTIVM